ncbi:MAG: hypothetical protein JWO58_1591 [Chitinophagaceae bacterium]|nr:hypothetical protein [Chitinophagaceae bacterium]
MKTILLPTDFTKHSQQAMKFAIHLAKRANAKIIVSHCFFVPNLDINTPVDILEDLYIDQKKAAEKSLMQTCQEISLHKNSKGETLQTEFIAEQDIPFVEILKLIQDKKIDLIVMGVEDHKHLFNLLGSTALHVSRTSSCPVLLIHEENEVCDFNRVYFALEDVKEDLAKVKQLIPLTRIYESEISILHIDPLPKNEDALEAMLYQKKQYDQLLSQIVQVYKHYPNIHFHYNISDETFQKMNQILQADRPDLLVLIHKERPLMESIFHKSVIRQFLKTSPVPLLILHG